MPTYEYKCNACGHQFERFQTMSSAPIKRCPQCGKSKVRRLIGTGAGLIFKGSGFYITDYRDKSYTDKAKAESGGGTGETKTESKSDSKPEMKSENKSETQSESKSESKSREPRSESKPPAEPKRSK